jgi:hypothetical protein
LSRLAAPVLAAALLLVVSVPARAHSLLLESFPAAGAALVASPPRITLRFNNRIEKRLSRIRLVDARGGTRVLVVSKDSEEVDELRAPAPALEPGAYRVEWQVLSTDGHVVSGGFSFRVGQ